MNYGLKLKSMKQNRLSEPKKGITRTPTKPKQEPDPIESIENKNYGNPIAKPL